MYDGGLCLFLVMPGVGIWSWIVFQLAIVTCFYCMATVQGLGIIMLHCGEDSGNT